VSILIDRLIGLVTFVVLGLACGPARAQRLQHVLRGRRARLARIVDDTGAALRQYGRDWRRTGLALLISVVIVGCAVGPIVLIAEAMAFSGPSPADYGLAAYLTEL
jgi:hypothetical protein